MNNTDCRVQRDTKEFMGVRSVKEGLEIFKEYHVSQHHEIIRAFTALAIEGRAADVELVRSLFEMLDFVESEVFEKGFRPVFESLDDIAVDAPKAYDIAAAFCRAGRLSDSQVQALADAIAVMGEPSPLPKEILMSKWNEIK